MIYACSGALLLLAFMLIISMMRIVVNIQHGGKNEVWKYKVDNHYDCADQQR